MGLAQVEEEKHRALTEIGQMARNSLDDLRRLLQTMRADEPAVLEALEEKVAPSSATIDLAQSVSDAQKRLSGLGFPTVVSTSGDLDRTPNGLRSTVVRILQESATNVAKHSGSGTECEIVVDVQKDRLELLIRNKVTAGKPRLPVSGTGLVGLRERTSRLGGPLKPGNHGVPGLFAPCFRLPDARPCTKSLTGPKSLAAWPVRAGSGCPFG
ncbi:sensor histidine kinase [Arthrobacter psychrolactophilus]